jgi:hypothetical protein
MIPLQNIYLKFGVWRDSVNRDLHFWFGFINGSFSRRIPAWDIELRIWPFALNLWRGSDRKMHFRIQRGWVNAHVDLPKDEDVQWKPPID